MTHRRLEVHLSRWDGRPAEARTAAATSRASTPGRGALGMPCYQTVLA
jgi:hypothetical protein